ncbi:MAG: magnesium citrate secondary transporter [Catalinimonas sp.]
MTWRPLRRPLFLVCAGGFALHQVVQRVCRWSLPWVDAYADDLFCLPVVLGLALWAMQNLRRQPTLRLSAGQIGFVWAYVVLVFEVWLPCVRPDYTADPWDAPAYAVGAILFAIWGNGKRKVTTSDLPTS